MGRMVKDLYRGIIPPPFMHGVGRREERVVIPDRNIGRVVKVAPSALRPRPAQSPGRDGDLAFAHANDRLERDPRIDRRQGLNVKGKRWATKEEPSPGTP
jgi:hypothetical protein